MRKRIDQIEQQQHTQLVNIDHEFGEADKFREYMTFQTSSIYTKTNAQHSRMDVAAKTLEQIKVKLEEIDSTLESNWKKFDTVIETQKNAALLVGKLSFKIDNMEKMIATENSVALFVGALSAKIENMEKMIASERRSADYKWEAKVAQDKLAMIAALFCPPV